MTTVFEREARTLRDIEEARRTLRNVWHKTGPAARRTRRQMEQRLRDGRAELRRLHEEKQSYLRRQRAEVRQRKEPILYGMGGGEHYRGNIRGIKSPPADDARKVFHDFDERRRAREADAILDGIF